MLLREPGGVAQPFGLGGHGVADLAAESEAVPEPLSERSYSGKFNLRVGESLHRRLAIQAAEEHLSLNQYVVQRLSQAS